MEIVNTGSTYRVYDESLKTYDKLPPQVYSIGCSSMSGFYLEKHPNLTIGEEKIYGTQMAKAEKVFRTFDKFSRSLGIILSGDKGMGKSLFAKILANMAIKRGLPVVIVDRYIDGVESFIASIEQEAVYIFDEFEKTFSSKNRDDISPQESMLSLFDGISPGKRMFVVTCNDVVQLNNYLVNRPGRFHYHFQFKYPSSEEVREYLHDKLDPKYCKEINNVVSFANKVELNYDCLRAIAFELNQGASFADAIGDLNILNLEWDEYDLTLHYDNGLIGRVTCERIDMFDDEPIKLRFRGPNGYSFAKVLFCPNQCKYNKELRKMIIPAKELSIEYIEDDPDVDEYVNQAKQSDALYIVFSRCKNNYKYTV